MEHVFALRLAFSIGFWLFDFCVVVDYGPHSSKCGGIRFMGVPGIALCGITAGILAAEGRP